MQATNRRNRVLAICAASALATPAVAQTTGLGEIVVTAQKVEQRSIDVPISLLVFDRSFFRNTRTTTLEDLARLSPSLFVNESVGSSYTNIAIRGIGSDALNSGVEPSVGVFIDGVYQGRPAFLASDLADVERVEILRGPQGTLYGKNSSAGAINIVSRSPGDRLEANAKAYYGNFSTLNLEGGVGGPVAAGVRARLSGYVTSRDGYIKNEIPENGGNSYDRFGVKGVLAADVTDALTLTLRGSYDLHRASIINYGLLAASPDLEAAAGAFGVVLPADIFGYRASANFRPRERITQFRTSLTADWDLGEGTTLTSITAYQQFRDNNISDVDYTGLDLLDGGSITSQDQISQELRVASDPGRRFSWLAGLFAFRQTQDDFGFNTVRPDLSLITGGFFPAGAQDIIESHSTVRTLAAFGQASYRLADALTATLGLRVDNQRNETRRNQPAGVTLPDLGMVALAKSDTNVSGTASLRYAFTTDAQAYATVSRGYKGGGYNGFGVPSVDAIGFDAERVTNYEIGLKGRFLDRRLSVEVSGFIMKIDDLQVSNFDGSNFIVGNAAKATSKGVEFNVTAEPTDGLVFGVSGTWNDAHYDSYPGAPCTADQSAPSAGICTQDLAGRPIANAPRIRGVVSAQYGRPIEALGVGVFARVDYSLSSSQYLNTALARQTLQGDYGVLNVRVGIEGPERRWGIYATAANITNSRFLRNAYDFPLFGGAYLAAPSRPRTYGVELQFNY